MALVKCKECGAEISKKAGKCPRCGAPVESHDAAAGCLVVVVMIAIVCALVSFCDDGKSDDADKPRTQEEIRQDQIERHFSSWDGSHLGLTKLIKVSMNDPDSYDHVETVYGDRGDHLVVKTTFRGRNAFGGVVTNWISAKVDLNGNVLEITAEGP